MRLSDKKRQELYNRIAGVIMDVRIELRMNPDLAGDEKLDTRLFQLERDIWLDVKRALNIQDA